MMIRMIVFFTATLVANLCAPATAPAQVKLEFKFPEGRASTYEARISVDQTLTINGQAIPTKSDQTRVATTQVGTLRDGGIAPVKHTIDSVKAKVSLPGGIELSIDSEDPQVPEGEQPQLTAVRRTIAALDGLSYTVLVGPGPEVAGVEGVDESLNGLDPEIAAALRQQLDAETLVKEYQQEYSLIPDEPISPGHTWENEEVMNLGEGQTLTFHRTYAYEGTVERGGKTLDRISVTDSSVDYAMNNPNSPLQVQSSDLKVVESAGEILFDREAGQLVEGKNSTRMTGSLVLAAGGQELPSELDLTIATNTTLKSSE